MISLLDVAESARSGLRMGNKEWRARSILLTQLMKQASSLVAFDLYLDLFFFSSVCKELRIARFHRKRVIADDIFHEFLAD
jgi:hypothetical protein